jgi:hypothetical protein
MGNKIIWSLLILSISFLSCEKKSNFPAIRARLSQNSAIEPPKPPIPDREELEDEATLEEPYKRLSYHELKQILRKDSKYTDKERDRCVNANWNSEDKLPLICMALPADDKRLPAVKDRLDELQNISKQERIAAENPPPPEETDLPTPEKCPVERITRLIAHTNMQHLVYHYIDVTNPRLSDKEIKIIFFSNIYSPDKLGTCVKTFWGNADKLSLILKFIASEDLAYKKIDDRINELRHKE